MHQTKEFTPQLLSLVKTSVCPSVTLRFRAITETNVNRFSLNLLTMLYALRTRPSSIWIICRTLFCGVMAP